MAHHAQATPAQRARYCHLCQDQRHALEDRNYLRQFPELRQEAIGNDHADKAANQARSTCFNPNVVRLSNTFVDRTQKYVDFLSHIHAVIARVHAASQNLRKSPAFSIDPDRHIISIGDKVLHTTPDIPHDLQDVPIRLKAVKKLVDQHLAKAGSLMFGFAQLLSHHTFATSPSRPGYTWLEFLLLSIAASPNPAAIYTSTTATPAKKLSHLIREFTNKAKTFLKFAYTPAVGAPSLGQTCDSSSR